MSFNKLISNPHILQSIQELGFVTPTDIQKQAIAAILQGVDLKASAQTGTGKTAAFILPALSLLTQNACGNKKGPRILILVPTRELALQVAQETKKYSKYLKNIKTVCVYGGESYHKQYKELKNPVDILVATPGRLMDHMEAKKISLRDVEILILDEADRMLDMGFIHAVEKIAASTPKSRQTLLFSATLKGAVDGLSKRLMHDALEIHIAPQDKTENIDQSLYQADDLEHKYRMLNHLLKDESIDQAIVFTATKHLADKVAKHLGANGHEAAALHGGMHQNKRTKTMMRMRHKKIKILVATDVAARGIDVLSISHVINFDLPMVPSDYVHRIGRTGRAGAKGIAFSFVDHKTRNLLRDIEKFTKKSIDLKTIPGLEPRKKEESKPSFNENKSFRKTSKNNFARKKFNKFSKGRNKFANKNSENFSKDNNTFANKNSENFSKDSNTFTQKNSENSFKGKNKRFSKNFNNKRFFKSKAKEF